MEHKTKSLKIVLSLKNQKRNHFCYCYYYFFFIKSERAQFGNNRNSCKENTETWKKRKKPSREESKSSHLDVGGLGEDEQVVADDQTEGDPPSEPKETQHRAHEPHRHYLIHHLAKQNQQGQIEEEEEREKRQDPTFPESKSAITQIAFAAFQSKFHTEEAESVGQRGGRIY